jgi:hypothetical protein
VNKYLRREIADTKIVLRAKIYDIRTGQSKKPPTTLDITKILRLPVAGDITLYNSDYVHPRNILLLESKEVNLQLSPSPPLAVPLPQASPESSPDPEGTSGRHKKSKTFSSWAMFCLSSWVYRFPWGMISQFLRSNRPSQSNAVLVSFMGSGSDPDIARIAAIELLASEDEKDSAAKQVLIKITRLSRKIILKLGLIGWRKRIKEDMERGIKNIIEKGVEEGILEELGELTEKDAKAWKELRELTEKDIKDWIAGDRI